VPVGHLGKVLNSLLFGMPHQWPSRHRSIATILAVLVSALNFVLIVDFWEGSRLVYYVNGQYGP